MKTRKIRYSGCVNFKRGRKYTCFKNKAYLRLDEFEAILVVKEADNSRLLNYKEELSKLGKIP